MGIGWRTTLHVPPTLSLPHAEAVNFVADSWMAMPFVTGFWLADGAVTPGASLRPDALTTDGATGTVYVEFGRC